MPVSCGSEMSPGYGEPLSHQPHAVLVVLMPGCWLGEETSKKIHILELELAFIFLEEESYEQGRRTWE